VAKEKMRWTWRRRVAGAASLGLIACVIGAFFWPPVQDLAQMVVRIVTDKGVVEIEADDANLMIAIQRAGQQEGWATIVNKQTKRAFEIKAGHGQIAISELRENGEKVGTPVTKPFDLPRGGRLVLSAKELFGDRNAKAIAPGVDGQANKGSAPGQEAAGKKEPGFVPLFNGKDLDGWNTRSERYFVQKDGSLLAVPLHEKQDGMLWTKKEFENYDLRFQCKVAATIPGLNTPHANLALHMSNSDSPKDVCYCILVSLRDGDAPLVGVGGQDAVGEKKALPQIKAPVPGAWNDVRILCQDRRIVVFLNGQEFWNGSRCNPSRGNIGLWAEHGDAYFRNIEIKELPAVPPPGQGWRPLFKGNLDGWEGDMAIWSLQDGKLVGDTRARPGPFRDCCLIGSQKYRDFELKFRARFANPGGIYCGVAVRNDANAVADAKTNRGISGPDVAIGKNTGGFYTVGGIGKYLKQPKDRMALDLAMKPGAFNDFTVRCVGKHVTITVNGVTTIDDDYPDIPDEGVIAFHVLRFPEPGLWQSVNFADIQIRELTREKE
jgi:hypothetical protein